MLTAVAVLLTVLSVWAVAAFFVDSVRHLVSGVRGAVSGATQAGRTAAAQRAAKPTPEPSPGRAQRQQDWAGTRAGRTALAIEGAAVAAGQGTGRWAGVGKEAAVEAVRAVPRGYAQGVEAVKARRAQRRAQSEGALPTPPVEPVQGTVIDPPAHPTEPAHPGASVGTPCSEQGCPGQLVPNGAPTRSRNASGYLVTQPVRCTVCEHEDIRRWQENDPAAQPDAQPPAQPDAHPGAGAPSSTGETSMDIRGVRIPTEINDHTSLVKVQRELLGVLTGDLGSIQTLLKTLRTKLADLHGLYVQVAGLPDRLGQNIAAPTRRTVEAQAEEARRGQAAVLAAMEQVALIERSIQPMTDATAGAHTQAAAARGA
jgi:hypothetical protein